MLFFKSINLTGYYARDAARRRRPAHAVDGTSYRGRFDYTDDRYGAAAEHMLIDRRLQRPRSASCGARDVRRSFGQLRFSPRPARNDVVRKLTWQASLDYVTDAAAIAVQSREASGLFRIDFQSSDQASLEYSREYELLPAPFAHLARRSGPGGRLHLPDHAREHTRSASSAACRAGCRQRPARLYGGARSDVEPTAADGAWCRASRSSRA